MFTAYFDASGTKRTMVLTVAGFVATAEEWKVFETEWKGLLPEGISVFHMKDFVSSKKGWEEWKGKSSRRAHFFAALVKCIRTHTRKGFALTIAMPDYNKINSEYAFSEAVGNPYPLVGNGALGQLKNWATKKRIDFRQIPCAFEEGDEDQGDLLNRARADGFDAITQSKKCIRAFDACDLAVWKARAIMDDSFFRELQLKDPRGADRILKSLDQLESITPDNGRLSANRMRNICYGFKIAKR
jgi:hypothetical protein